MHDSVHWIEPLVDLFVSIAFLAEQLQLSGKFCLLIFSNAKNCLTNKTLKGKM